IHHPVLLVHHDVGGGGDSRHLELARARAAVQRLDVLQHVLDLEPLRLHLAGGEGVEHEGIVGVGTVTDPEQRHEISLGRCLLARSPRASGSCTRPSRYLLAKGTTGPWSTTLSASRKHPRAPSTTTSLTRKRSSSPSLTTSRRGWRTRSLTPSRARMAPSAKSRP